jgi:hypothetical protein
MVFMPLMVENYLAQSVRSSRTSSNFLSAPLRAAESERASLAARTLARALSY